MSVILGISAFYHDSAAALVCDGVIMAAAQEERFSRRKNDADFPVQAIAAVLAQAELGEADVDAVVYHEKPVRKFARVLESFAATAPAGLRAFVRGMPGWLRGKLDLPGAIRAHLPDLRRDCPILFASHHQSHAASAWHASGFPSAAVLTIDGVGEWATALVAHGNADGLRPLLEMRFPHSPGLLYSAFTDYCGFRINSGEYKLMGLAPYGTPAFRDLILQEVIALHPDGSFHLRPECFAFLTGERMTSGRFHRLFGGPPRRPSDPLEQRHADIARSIQDVTGEIVLRMARTARARTGESALCMAGGVALNCVANAGIARDSGFARVWVQPAAGDAGAALGAALAVASARGELPPAAGTDRMAGGFLGPEYSQHEICRQLDAAGACYELLRDDELIRRTAAWLASGRALGWFQGRMEFGPRALGNRSILADPRPPDMQRSLNLQIKFRESFRPFAPVVLAEKAHEWFDLPPAADWPYMLFTASLRSEHLRAPDPALRGFDRLQQPLSAIPAVTHVDGSARVQTVDPLRHGRLHALLSEFDRLTGIPVLVNTSFNVRGEPIVATPTDAWRCFCRTNLPLLVIGNCWIDRTSQLPDLCPVTATPPACPDD